ncbi:Crp family transcriptional regulator [Novosphingobium sp. Rr 2-17]|uniref:Crp/Fnr family transcriptional regulator n=1 Tax=Novosphingobium sp. Rr 2-17 TaxID=555793 RepID=UPI0002697E4F|nr:Crp/Fnr family transcriptional regulator [Novosphingobium sp. Rr 2-17]EIZ80746.1 Crp family transcriptional regulator [Novosphingobium sp. Rr 2-17]
MSKRVCEDCGVREVGLCGSLDDAELADLNKIGRRRHIERGETIAWAGDESQTCGNVLSGMFKVSAALADGREQTVGLLYPADFVGRPYASTNDFSITALSDAEVCVFPATAFEETLEQHTKLERELLRRTLSSLDEARERQLMLARASAGERVASFLMVMARKTSGMRPSPEGPLTFDLPLSRGAIAEVLGLTIETVSRQMTKLRAAGIIALPGGRAVTILREAALEEIATAA